MNVERAKTYKMKTIFITRTDSEKDIGKNLDKLKKLLKEVRLSGIQNQDIYVISNFENPKYSIGSASVEVVKDNDPTGPVSLNAVLKKVESKGEVEAFLVCSKEVDLDNNNIKELMKTLERDKKSLLVVGYKFQIVGKNRNNNTDLVKQLDNELQNYYKNGDLTAYQVPWNTCAMWNYALFKKIKKFDEITLGRYPLGQITVTVDGVSKTTDHKGMEDGLAIAEAVSKESQTKYYLIDKTLPWEIDISDPKKVLGHRVKLGRKDYVLKNFMALRNYSIEDLKAAKQTE